MVDMFDFGDGAGPVPARRHPNGGGWVADTALVEPTAHVGIDAQVLGHAQIRGKASVSGKARVSGFSRVRGNARVYGSARVFGSAQVHDNAQVSGNAWVLGKARVSGDSLVCDSAYVSGRAEVLGTARVRGDAFVCGGKWPRSPLYIEGSRHSVTMCAPGVLAIGCQSHSIKYWIAYGREIGAWHDYTDAEIEEYERYIRLAAEMCPGESGNNG